jgi:hypothetical protein
MKTTLTYLTASLATLVVGIAAGATAVFIYDNPTAVVANLAPAVMAGAGSTLGAALGGLIVLRFKVVRTFIKELIK